MAIDLTVRYPELVSRLVSYAGAPAARKAVPMSKKTLAVLTDMSGSVEERGMRLLTLLFPQAYRDANPKYYESFPQTDRADVAPRRSSGRTGRSASGRACGAASRASRARPCSSRAPRT